jgi:hypothetical protein
MGENRRNVRSLCVKFILPTFLPALARGSIVQQGLRRKGVARSMRKSEDNRFLDAPWDDNPYVGRVEVVEVLSEP